MFQKGDFVTYAGKGVCIIRDVTTLNMEGIPKDRLYYQMQLVSDERSRVFTPVEQEEGKGSMRAVMSQEEALDLMEELREMQAGWIRDDREREAQYRDVLGRCDARGMLAMIYMLHCYRKERMLQGRRLPAMDTRYLNLAQDTLFAELAVVLKVTKEEIQKQVTEKIQLLESTVKSV